MTVEGGLTTDQVHVDVSAVSAITIDGGSDWKQMVVLTGAASISDYQTVLSTARYSKQLYLIADDMQCKLELFMVQISINCI